VSIIRKNLLVKCPKKAFLIIFLPSDTRKKQQSCHPLLKQKPKALEYGIKNANEFYAYKK